MSHQYSWAGVRVPHQADENVPFSQKWLDGPESSWVWQKRVMLNETPIRNCLVDLGHDHDIVEQPPTVKQRLCPFPHNFDGYLDLN